ncbi:Copper ion binding protein [Quillaja saponaria]|uniref:Copper ion binding protein n=1 Tax=Quillaja saponaria TaxID=32244 RepID=A0AAD7PD71_QUISA|nr:Copper ion binding protein [Quillaja saponaria]
MILRIAKLKTLFQSIDSSSTHQLTQRCSKAGTAKGKAKLKSGQPLKRSKVTTKKGAADVNKEGGGGKGSLERQEREKLYDQCLNAPTPIRYLTEKQRAREAEREKLGLMSKDRQRELEIMKNNKGLEVSETPIAMGPPGLDLISLGLVDEDEIPKYELTVEDGRRLAKEYSRVLMKKHRARQAAESTLLRLKKEAIEALPEHLKAAALGILRKSMKLRRRAVPWRSSDDQKVRK